MAYDSSEETNAHRSRVLKLISLFCGELMKCGLEHDKSKLENPEKPLFDEMTPKLKGCTYGSDEYKQFLEELKPALDHHYKHNSHHPEHSPQGFAGMTLFDVVEAYVLESRNEQHSRRIPVVDL